MQPDGYQIDTHGPGVPLTRERDGETRWLQGDDAWRFLRSMDRLANDYPSLAAALDMACGPYFESTDA